MKAVIAALLVGALSIVALSEAHASGGKNRGDKGQGMVMQEQHRRTDEGTPAFGG